MRARCIARPQFGQAGPAVTGWLAGRNEFWIANIIYLLVHPARFPRTVKRLIEIQTPV
jgi:hypothetical protein